MSLKSQYVLGLVRYFVFIVLGLIAVYLCRIASKDWVHYNFLYYLDGLKSWQDMVQGFSFFREPLYFFSAKFFGQFIGFSNFIAITTVVFLVLKLHYLFKIVGDAWLVCFFYSCLCLFLFEGTVLRIAYATALIAPAFYYLRERRVLSSLFFVFLATQIQLTTIVFILAYPLYFFRRLNWFVVVFFLVAPLVIIMDFSVFELVVRATSYFTDKYQFYDQKAILVNQNSTGLFFYFVAFFYVVNLVLLYALSDSWLNDPFKQSLLSLAMLGVIAMCLMHDHVAVGARLGELFFFSLVPLLCWLFLRLNSADYKWRRYGVIAVFFTYGIARFVYLFPSMIFSAK